MRVTSSSSLNRQIIFLLICPHTFFLALGSCKLTKNKTKRKTLITELRIWSRSFSLFSLRALVRFSSFMLLFVARLQRKETSTSRMFSNDRPNNEANAWVSYIEFVNWLSARNSSEKFANNKRPPRSMIYFVLQFGYQSSEGIRKYPPRCCYSSTRLRTFKNTTMSIILFGFSASPSLRQCSDSNRCQNMRSRREKNRERESKGVVHKALVHSFLLN